ncbi:MAG: signal recognition particle protein [Proteobacteria bacterium]|nr:signal recognition particle protein [Pseudomonadota bacterium]
MFSSLSDGFDKIFAKLKGRGFITEADIKEVTREIRINLLEADVSLSVIKHITEKIKNSLAKKEIVKSLKASEVIMNSVHNELLSILQHENQKSDPADLARKKILLVGLQGAGKTSTAGKLALYLSNIKRKICMVSLDNRRPAAQKQLELLGARIKVETLPIIENQKPEEITRRAILYARDANIDTLILDTAGRSNLDQDLINELKHIQKIADAEEILLVVDSMLGQSAVRIAEEFQKHINITGIIFTKIDGDARGGAMLSMRFTTGVPIKFLSTGEKPEDFEAFHPDRVVSRILGMGDVETLVEKVKAASEEDLHSMQNKLQQGKFDMDDFLKQLKMLKKLGGFSSILGMLPGSFKQFTGILNNENTEGIDSKSLIKSSEAIILSMTKKERRNPRIIDASRKKRIANGSGSSVASVNKLLKQFTTMQNLAKQFSGSSMQDIMKKFKMPF